MPKKGHRQPYKVEFTYPGRETVRSAKGDHDEADMLAREIAARGATTRVLYVDTDTKATSTLAEYTRDDVALDEDDEDEDEDEDTA